MTRENLRRIVIRTLMAVLDVAVLDDSASFIDQGLDSLAAVEFRDKLQTALGVQLHAGITGDYPTVDRMVDYLHTVLQ